MIYLITGITGTVVPVIVEDLLRKDTAGTNIAERFEGVVTTLRLEPAERELLGTRSHLVDIDVTREGLGIEPRLRAEIMARVDKILHGAADVRFDQPYDSMRIPNVVFAEQVYALFAEIREARAAGRRESPTLYCLSTAYAYGVYPGPIPEDDRAYHLHYLLLMLGYLGKLPFLCSPDNTLDIVPVDWVAAVISDVIIRGELRQGVLRLASGADAITVRQLHDAAYPWYSRHDPVPGHVIPKIRFVPAWSLPPMVALAGHAFSLLYAIGRRPAHRRRARQLAMLQGYLPYVVGTKRFENERSTALIHRYTDCGPAPRLQDVVDQEGQVVEHGYCDKILADTLATGWGGLVDFARVSRGRAVKSNRRPVR